MQELYGWAFQVGFVAVVFALVEQLLPEGNLKKYAKVGFGLLLVSAILQPLAGWIAKIQ